MRKKIEKSFLNALYNSFKAYNTYGARSNKKLIPIHTWFAKTIISNLGDKYSCNSLRNKEYTLEGKYYPKKLDITILYEDKPIVTLSFKFVTSNYAQNANNYFENLLGETANIRRVSVAFTHFLVMRAHTPYYDKAAGSKRGKLKKVEILRERHLQKYIKLFRDLDFPHKPEVLGIAIVDFDKKGKVFFADLNDLELSPNTIKTVNDEFSVGVFIRRIIALCKLKS